MRILNRASRNRIRSTALAFVPLQDVPVAFDLLADLHASRYRPHGRRSDVL